MKFGEYFKPMLLKERTKIFDDENYLYELKFDGYRATIHVSPNSIKIFSRNGMDLTQKFTELKSIRQLVNSKTIFDGEIVAFENDKPSFNALQKRARIKSNKQIDELKKQFPVVFVAFDCLFKNRSLINKPLLERKKILEDFQENDYFLKSTYVIGTGRKLFSKIKKLNLEGIVAKKIDSLYYPSIRSEDWIKIKNYKIEEFYIGGFIDTNFKRSLLLGEYLNGNFYFIGKVSVDKKIVLNSKTITKSPFTNFTESKINYFKPTQKCLISYIERTPNNNLREPVFKRMC